MIERKNLSDRERDIINLACELLAQVRSDKRALDEMTIDALFLFRFEPTWCEMVGRIRGMMRAMIGKTGCKPLSVEDGSRLWVHLEHNAGTSVSIETGPDGTKYRVTTARRGYICLDEELDKALGNMLSLDEGDAKCLWQQMRMEANQTSKIEAELERLALRYHLIPSKTERERWTPDDVRRQYQSVVNWVIFGEIPPLFPTCWSGAIMLESTTKGGVKRNVSPWPLHERGHWRTNADGSRTWIKDGPEPPKRMEKWVRIRTWTIYYLTRRGGGERSEEETVDLWNSTFNENVLVNNFRSERTRLFGRGARKSIR